MIGRTRHTVRRLLNAGELAYVHVGLSKRRAVKLEDLQAFLDRRRTPSKYEQER